MSTELQIYERPMNVAEIRKHVSLIHDVMQEIMQKDEHYGTIPGCKKPSLYKAGAEKLNLAFRMAPEYDIKFADLPGGHREVTVTCRLYSIGNRLLLGEGVGSASTMEAKYRYRDMGRVCPECEQETIIKGKEQYGGGWLCFKKKGGCGAKFKDDDPAITEQIAGKIEYDNPADYYNTVLKMAKKRAHVDAVLTVTAASDIFTQDIDEPDIEPGNEPPPEETKEEEIQGALAQFDRMVAEKKPPPELQALLPKFLSAYPNMTPEQVKVRAFADFNQFWQVFVEWSAGQITRKPRSDKGTTRKPTAPPDAAPLDTGAKGQTEAENATTGGTEGYGIRPISREQVAELQKAPPEFLEEAYKVCNLNPNLPLEELTFEDGEALLKCMRVK